MLHSPARVQHVAAFTDASGEIGAEDGGEMVSVRMAANGQVLWFTHHSEGSASVVTVWGPQWYGSVIQIICDNEAAVEAGLGSNILKSV